MNQIQELPQIEFVPSLESFNVPDMYPILDDMISPFLALYLPILFTVLGSVFLVKSFR